MKKKINKPDYLVPSMAKVRKMEKKNGLKVISTFSGCGGSSLGYRMAGFDVVFANEFWKTAADVYEANSAVKVCRTDICKLTARQILRATGLAQGELNVLDGSPPCQTFSTAGKRDMSDKRTDLFMEYIRLLKGLQPQAFVAENVSGMVKGVAKGMFKIILKKLKAVGYRVEARMLDAQWLGVPQVRRRIIFVGIRDDLKLDPVFPIPFKYQYSVADACPWIGSLEYKRGEKDPSSNWNPYNKDFAVKSEPCSTILKGEDQNFKVKSLRKLTPTALRMLSENKTVGFISVAEGTKPSPTVLKNIESLVCKEGKRRFTINELKRICSFPNDFDSSPAGSYTKEWAVYGNSVPPLMMKAIAETLARKIFKVKRKSAKRKIRR